MKRLAILGGIVIALAGASLKLEVRPFVSYARPADQTPKLVKDPVCGMDVDPVKAAGKSEHKGKVYYFCSEHCKKRFDANPEAILGQKKK